MKTCPICRKEFDGHGHNPWPITSMIEPYVGGTCCDDCNWNIVTPARSLMERFTAILDRVAQLRSHK